MLQLYLNYPVGKVSAHRLATCGNIRMMNKTDQREIKITLLTLSMELQKFVDNAHRFGSTSNVNDMWVALDLQSEPFELAVVDFIQQVLGRQYKRFADSQVVLHC